MKTDAKQIIEIVGIFGVIASLIFVGFQLRQDRIVAIGEQFFNRSEAGRETALARFSNDIWAEEVARRWDVSGKPGWWTDEVQELQDLYEFSNAAMYRYYQSTLVSMINFDNFYYQYQLGLIDEESWLAIRENRKQGLQSGAVRAIYRNSGGLRPEAKLLVEELIMELESQ